MASTKIADVIVPSVFNPYSVQRTTELSRLYTSGIIQAVPELNVLGMKGGTTIAMPYWKDLTGAEEILSDTVPLGVDKITTAQDVAVLHARGKAWGVNDLAKALSGDDPMAEIGDMVGDYWARRWQVMLLSILKGVFLAASMSANIHDISGLSGDAAVLGGDGMVDAMYKLGDASGGLTAAAMHSATVALLVKQGLIDMRNDADGNPVEIAVRLPQSERTWDQTLASMPVGVTQGPAGPRLVELGEVATAGRRGRSPPSPGRGCRYTGRSSRLG